MRKVFDTFTFYNEFDMLEFRLMELDSVVDKFIISESTLTFSGNKKPLYFEENKHRFKKYLHKIHHVVVDDSPQGFTRDKTWEREYHQRNSIANSLNYLGLKEEDIIIHGDVDEIPDVNIIKKWKNEGVPCNAQILQMENFYYNNVLDRIQACLDGLGNKVINLLKKICACLSENIFAMCR